MTLPGRRNRSCFGLCAALVAAACTKGAAEAPPNSALDRTSHDARFPIAAGPHAVDCSACHGAADSFLAFDCLGCHAVAPTAAIHAGVSRYRWASGSCYACHQRGTGIISPADHAGFFPIGGAESHALGRTVTAAGTPVQVACGVCHVDAANRGNADCTTCHLQAASAGAPGPAAASDQQSAHAGKVGTTNAAGAAHNLWLGTGPVGDGSGATARCLKCHAADKERPGFVAVHGAASARTGNAVFVIASSSNHFVSCDQCHTVAAAKDGRKNPEFDFANGARCDLCHAPAAMISDHAQFPYNGQPGVTIDPAQFTASNADNASQCLSCHATGGAAANFTHAWFPIGDADKHGSGVARCGTCHSDPSTYSGPPAANIAKITCTACHDDSAANARFQNGLTVTAVHQAARVGRDIWDVPSGLSYSGGAPAAINALCLKCHAGNIGGAVAAVSTPLVFRLSQHDAHCGLNGRSIANPASDSTHWVSRNADNGVNICFACHNALAAGTATPWAADWSVASPSSSCTACHEHEKNPAPAVTCQ